MKSKHMLKWMAPTMKSQPITLPLFINSEFSLSLIIYVIAFISICFIWPSVSTANHICQSNWNREHWACTMQYGQQMKSCPMIGPYWQRMWSTSMPYIRTIHKWYQAIWSVACGLRWHWLRSSWQVCRIIFIFFHWFTLSICVLCAAFQGSGLEIVIFCAFSATFFIACTVSLCRRPRNLNIPPPSQLAAVTTNVNDIEIAQIAHLDQCEPHVKISHC